jgi:hypothetical protein
MPAHTNIHKFQRLFLSEWQERNASRDTQTRKKEKRNFTIIVRWNLFSSASIVHQQINSTWIQMKQNSLWGFENATWIIVGERLAWLVMQGVAAYCVSPITRIRKQINCITVVWFDNEFNESINHFITDWGGNQRIMTKFHSISIGLDSVNCIIINVSTNDATFFISSSSIFLRRSEDCSKGHGH